MKQFASLSLLSIALFSTHTEAKQSLTFNDVFDFKQAKHHTLSDNGQFLAFSAEPYRGDSQGQVYSLASQKLIAEIAGGTKPSINKNALWVGFTVTPSLLESESSSKDEKKKLTNKLVLVNTQSGAQLSFEKVVDYQISDDGNWLAYRKKEKPAKNKKSDDKPSASLKADKDDKAHTLYLVNLTNQQATSYDAVLDYDFAADSMKLLVSQTFQDGANNQISLIEVSDTPKQTPLIQEPGLTTAQIDWHPNKASVAFTASNYLNDDMRRRDYTLYLWQQDSNQLSTITPQYQNWFVGKQAKLSWSLNGERLYFEATPQKTNKVTKKKYKTAADLTDFDVVRDQRGLTIWHPEDDYIKPREKKQWQEKQKYIHYQAVYHLADGKSIQLETPEVGSVSVHKEATHLLGRSNLAYRKEETHNGFFNDFFAVDVATGNKQLIIKKSRFAPSLSPNGQFTVYQKGSEIVFKNLSKNTEQVVTQGINAEFIDKSHDYPSEQPAFGVAGWSKDNNTFYLYDKYDIWAFDSASLQGARLTKGYLTQTQYRIVNLNKSEIGIADDAKLTLSSYNLDNKQSGIASLNLATKQLKAELTGEAKYTVVTKAKDADTLLFTKQDYHTYPDFWVTSIDFANKAKVTNLNPQIAQFNWGEKPELVDYKGYNGNPLKGVLIKPAGYKKGDKVPVVIYFYRFMTDRMYDFPKMELNHRPNFPMFTSNGYAVFLPDIEFEIGHPGKSSTQTMINAAQKLIDMGVAHPDKIGLQGHSWAGYQSAFMITQTDMFKAVVSGAPVSNMTSAYSGIRLKTGLARQFQYETGQSRIGKNLFEARDLYIENSPVFFADKVNTPIMIMFGDRDDAVPWDEGVQYYLALKRANKDVIFLQYHDEPHHLKKFPNQLDFSIRMMEYFEHHLKGKPAPDWIKQGEAYQSED